MAMQFLFDPNMQFSAKNGALNVNGKLRLYFNGTDDIASTYADFNSTLNPFPVVLDSNGRATVIVDSTYTYRLEVYNSNDSLLWTCSNLTANGGTIVIENNYPVIVDQVTGETTVVNSVDAGGYTHYAVGIAPAYTAARDAHADSAVAAEATARQAADAALSASISAETAARQSADAALSDSIAAEKSRAEAAEAAAKTTVTAGDNIMVTQSTAADGHYIYNVSGTTPNVSITSDDNSVNISENSTSTSKTFDLSVNKSVSNYIGQIGLGATVPTVYVTTLELQKTSGTLSGTSSAVTIPAGTYHITLNMSVYTDSYLTNTIDDTIVIGDNNSVDVFFFHPSVNTAGDQGFTMAFDRTFGSETQLYFVSKAGQSIWKIYGNLYIHSIANINGGGSGTDSYEVKVQESGDAGYLYNKVNTTVPIQKKVENDQLVIYQDPVQASPLSMLSTPSVDNVLSTLNVVTNGTQQGSWIAIQAHAFIVPNYFVPTSTVLWNYVNTNTQGSTAETVHFVGIYAYDLTSNKINLVAMSVNGASHDNTSIGLAQLATGYVNTTSPYNIIKPGIIYYAFHACDQTALTVAGNGSSTFNLSTPYPSLILYNLRNGLTVTDFVSNYGTIDLSTSTLSHQESTGKRFLAVRHAS